MPQISKEIKIALLGICAILLFIFGYNYLKGTGMFSSSKFIRAEYDNVQGLTPASYVQIQGFTVGSVKDILLSKEHPGKVLVIMTVDKDMVIPEDSKANIVSLDLLGTKAVNLVKGLSTKEAADNQLIDGDVTMGTIESIGAQATPAIDSAKLVLGSLNQTIRNINNILDETAQANLRNTVANLNNTMKDMSEFAAQLNAQNAKIATIMNSMSSFATSLDKSGPTLTRVLDNADITTANLKRTDFEGAIKELKVAMNEMQSILQKVNNGNGSIALMMNDDKLYKNLKNTLATANNLLADVGARPSRYINVTIFGKKNKNVSPPPPAPNSND